MEIRSRYSNRAVTYFSFSLKCENFLVIVLVKFLKTFLVVALVVHKKSFSFSYFRFSFGKYSVLF